MSLRKTLRTGAAVLAAGALAGSLAACSSGGSGSGEEKEESGSGDASGSVYFLNFKPEQADAWDSLAAAYVDETGVPVVVQTAASGTYESTLKSEMAKSEPPTIFQVNGPVGLATWKDYAANLKDTAIYEHLKDKSMALENADGDYVYAVPYVIETYGLIYNKALLDKYMELPDAAVTSVAEIDNFETLKKVADGIQKDKDELGVKGAFASAGFDASSDWRFKTHLANIPLYYELSQEQLDGQPESIKGTYLPQYKQIFDLYLDDSTTDRTALAGKTMEDATAEFALGECVFLQNGTWAWGDLEAAGMSPDDLGMLPIYIGADGESDHGLATGSENFWVINDKVSEADQKASEKFLEWVITSDTGRKSLTDEMGFVTPFDTFDGYESTNPLVQADSEYFAEGKTPVGWYFTLMPSEEWKDGVGQSLLAYAQGTGDWDAVQKAYVDGWSKEVDLVNQNKSDDE